MVACRYVISLIVFNFISHSFAGLTREISSWTLEEIFHIYARPCIILYICVIGRLGGPYRKKTVTEVLKMLPEVYGLGQHFQARGHSFSLYGPTLSRPKTCLFYCSCGKLAYKWFVYATLSLNRLTCRLQTIRKRFSHRASNSDTTKTRSRSQKNHSLSVVANHLKSDFFLP